MRFENKCIQHIAAEKLHLNIEHFFNFNSLHDLFHRQETVNL